MSRTYKTLKESVMATQRMKRDLNGELLLPRIIVKPPTKGDIHPLTHQELHRVLKRVPVEYLYGLHHVELRGRRSNEIGQPFGQYSPSLKVITLYSLPREWKLKWIGRHLRQSLPKFHADVSRKEDQYLVTWPKKVSCRSGSYARFSHTNWGTISKRSTTRKTVVTAVANIRSL